jgi:hypothetical protein
MNTSFVEKYHHETHPVGRGSGTEWPAGPFLRVSDLYPQSVRGVSLDGTAVDITDLRPIWGEGHIESKSGSWTVGGFWYEVDVRYTAGYTTQVPSDVRDAALIAVRYKLLSVEGESAIPSRATTITNEYGNVGLATPGKGGSITGIPEVDEVISAWRDQIAPGGFA